MKQLLLLYLMILPALGLQGKHVSEISARHIAVNYYSHYVSVPDRNVSIAKTIYFRTKEDTTMYIFTFSPGGFVIVSADDCAIPVLAYSPEGTFCIDNIPPNIESWINHYSTQIHQLSHNGFYINKNIKDRWEKILKGEFPDDGKSVGALLSTIWDQDCYYNFHCPAASAGPCGKALTGCGATAMAQVMRYHSYPSKGNGSHGYYHNVYGYLYADFGNTFYEWLNMPDIVHVSSSIINIEAVSVLMFHCGVAVDMNYGPQSSSSGLSSICNALVNYFNYLGTAQMVSRSDYSDWAWAELLKNNINASLPVLYRGADNANENGHLFVIDGYSEQGYFSDYFHINWGWGGVNNGLYYLYDLTPPGSAQFNYFQYAIVDIEPGYMNQFPINKDFQDNDINSGGWTVEPNWEDNPLTWYIDFYKDKYYARASGYSSGINYAIESWLISPRFSNSLGRRVCLSFDNATKWEGPPLQTLISLDWDGNPSGISSASWVSLSPALSPGNWNFVNSGVLDLSSYSGPNIHIAFRYYSTSSAAATWEIDNIKIYENTNGIEENGKENNVNLSLFPNPAMTSVTIESALLKGELNVRLINILGKELMNKKIGFSGKCTLDISAIPDGVYLLTLERTDGNRFSTRFVKTK